MAETTKPVQLEPQTVQAFDRYIRETETAMEETLHGSGLFLWSEVDAERARQVRGGKIVAQFWSGRGPSKAPNGLIHDWIGSAVIPDSTLEDVLALIQNYDDHKNIYKPEVIDSQLISREDNHFQVYLRLLKKKIVTVVLDTDHEVDYRPLDRTRWLCRSYSSRIAEVENAGRRDERVLPPDTGYGFLWRLHSYWRFQQRDGGVVVECRAISLTRDVPFGLGWAIDPIIQKLPRESLIHNLRSHTPGVATCGKIVAEIQKRCTRRVAGQAEGTQPAQSNGGTVVLLHYVAVSPVDRVRCYRCLPACA